MAKESELDEFQRRQNALFDAAKLMIECLGRISIGQSPDPKIDATNTLRGVMIFAVEFSDQSPLTTR